MSKQSPIDQTTLQDGLGPTVLRLQSAARMLAKNPTCPEACSIDLELVGLVDDCLQSCRDGILLQALNGLRNEEKAHDLLRSQVHIASSTALVDTAEGPRAVRLCAIPILLSNEQPLEHGRLERGAAFNALSASLRKSGFIHAEARVDLADYLYHPKELQSMWPSEVYRLPSSLLAHATGCGPGGPLHGLPGLGRSGWPCIGPPVNGSPRVQLRFLLVTICEDLGTDDLLEPCSEDEHERLQVALSDWAARASSPLAGALGLSADEVVVLCFGPYARSLAAGFESLRYVDLRSALAPLVRDRALARDLSVTLELCGDDGEECGDKDATAIRLLATSSARDDATRRSGRSLEHHYPITSQADAAASLERVVSVLRNAGVRRIWVARHPRATSRFDAQHVTVRGEQAPLSIREVPQTRAVSPGLVAA
jgi:hypothetical protein